MKKGNIVEFVFKDKNTNSKVLQGKHRVIVLHSRQTPYKTILIAPITTLTSLKNSNSVPSHYPQLKLEDYPGILTHDSYINLDMMMVVDSTNLIEFERNGKVLKSSLTPEDLKTLDFNIIMTYELQEYIDKEFVVENVKQEIENIVEYMDTDIRDELNKIKNLLSDPKAIELLESLLNIKLIETIKKSFGIEN